MKRLINFNNSDDDLLRYGSRRDVADFISQYACDGLEYMRIPECSEDKIPLDLVYGIHLSSVQNWMDLWLGRNEALVKEFGSMTVAEEFYGGCGREALLRRFSKELDCAQGMGVQYVVFHISEVTIKESFYRQFVYSDAQVVDAAGEMINRLLDGKDYTFDFLMENLWWPGMNLTDPAITRRLLERVHYKKKGIMLDTGHLMSTNRELRSQEEGVTYINDILDAHGNLCSWIKGVHLHQSLTGPYVKTSIQENIQLKEEYWERFGQAFEHIFKIDKHEPFTAVGVKPLIDRMNPKYLTYEFVTRSRREHEEFLSRQIAALGIQESPK